MVGWPEASRAILRDCGLEERQGGKGAALPVINRSAAGLRTGSPCYHATFRQHASLPDAVWRVEVGRVRDAFVLISIAQVWLRMWQLAVWFIGWWLNVQATSKAHLRGGPVLTI